MQLKLGSVTIFVLWVAVLTHVFLVGKRVFTNLKPSDCPFCQAYNSSRFKFFEDDTVFALKDEFPSCALHMLIIPVNHTKDVHSMTTDLLVHMNQTCHDLLDSSGGQGERVAVFHRPPYYSIPHLHLHCKLCSPEDTSLLSFRGLKNLLETWTALSVEEVGIALSLTE
jgi:hypothetical protein